MAQNGVQRTIRLVDFDWPRGPVSIDELMALPKGQWEHLRYEITKQHQLHPSTPLARCRLCEGGVFIRSQATRTGLSPVFAHYPDAPQDCPWHHGTNLHPDDARAAQYNGQQESALHRWLCDEVAKAAGRDARCKDVEVDAYRRPTIAGRGRWPDVYFEFEGLGRFAVEIQLSKPFAPEIVARQLFYAREGISLIWLFREVGTSLPQGFRDVITLQRGNAFVISDDALRASEKQKTLSFDCYVELADGSGFGRPKRVVLDDLTLDSGRSVYLVDQRTRKLKEYCSAGRRKWREAFKEAPATESPDPFTEAIYHRAWDSVRMFVPALSEWKADYWQANYSRGDVFYAELVAILYSIAHSSLGNGDKLYLTRIPSKDGLLPMLNAKLSGAAMKPYATMIETFLALSARNDLLERGSLTRAFAHAKATVPQVTPSHPTWQGATRIFPEILDGVRRQEMIDVHALPTWAGG